jgi:hypothetical protein
LSIIELDESVRQLVTDTLRSPAFRRATFGGAVRGGSPSLWVRVVVRPVELRGARHLQFSYFDAKKNITRNHRDSEIEAPLEALLHIGFAGIHLSTETEEVDIRTTRKGKVHIGRRKAEAAEASSPQPHNRVKDVPLPEGKADHLLHVMGILTSTGRVRPTMRAKYTQVNEFLKQLTHVLDDAELRSLGRDVQILDCGCGLSYLTLAVHHYLSDILGFPAHILGVDVNEEVIRKSVERSEHLGAERLRFLCGRIGTLDVQPDIVLALHACDTATDDAIAQAIRSEAKILLSVPCCHHYLNDRLRPDGPAEVLRPLLRHGILQQRTADQVTDAFRALILRIMGYRTEVVEFVSPEHTARNLMIRAVRGAPIGDKALIAEYEKMCRFWGVTPYLAGLLGEPFRGVVAL